MMTPFPLFSRFQSHLELAHTYWNMVLKPGDIAIDATCGNGHDTKFIADIVLTKDLGIVYACDLQPQAIESTKLFLKDDPYKDRVKYFLGCHSSFSKAILPHSVKLIVYNLGYLPKGDKELTTQSETTLQSIEHAMELICKGGMISITCYPGHTEGMREERHVLDFTRHLDPKCWWVCHHQWINRVKSPSVLILHKLAG